MLCEHDLLKELGLPIILFSLGFFSCFDTPEGVEALTYEERLAADIEAIDEFLEKNEIDAIEHVSGIRYVVLKEGEGKQPNGGSSVNVKYEGRHFNGSVFDSNDTGVTFPLPNLILSWQIAIPLMKEGGKLTVYAPSGLCYGTSGTTGISPNSSLNF